jgi:hypothetical protein
MCVTHFYKSSDFKFVKVMYKQSKCMENLMERKLV